MTASDSEYFSSEEAGIVPEAGEVSGEKLARSPEVIVGEGCRRDRDELTAVVGGAGGLSKPPDTARPYDIRLPPHGFLNKGVEHLIRHHGEVLLKLCIAPGGGDTVFFPVDGLGASGEEVTKPFFLGGDGVLIQAGDGSVRGAQKWVQGREEGMKGAEEGGSGPHRRSWNFSPR